MSEDWIPVPEIENVLIVLAELSDDIDTFGDAPVLNTLKRLQNWDGGSVYVFHDPPEAGEIFEDVEPDMAARFALAAQMTENFAEVCRDAFRRVFSRAVVQRVLLISDREGTLEVCEIESLLRAIGENDLVWAGDYPNRFCLGMSAWHEEIFSDLDAVNENLRKVVESIAAGRQLKLRGVDNI